MLIYRRVLLNTTVGGSADGTWGAYSLWTLKMPTLAPQDEDNVLVGIKLTTSAAVSTRHVCLHSNSLVGVGFSVWSIMYKRSPPSEHPAMKPFKRARKRVSGHKSYKYMVGRGPLGIDKKKRYITMSFSGMSCARHINSWYHVSSTLQPT